MLPFPCCPFFGFVVAVDELLLGLPLLAALPAVDEDTTGTAFCFRASSSSEKDSQTGSSFVTVGLFHQHTRHLISSWKECRGG